MWLALAYGRQMTNTDMVIFRATSDGIVQDLWAQGYQIPTVDTDQNYKDINVIIADGFYTFTAYRAADTGDRNQDTVINCGYN